MDGGCAADKVVSRSGGPGQRLTAARQAWRHPTVDIPLLLAASVGVLLVFQRRSFHRRTVIALLAVYVGYITFALLCG